MLKLKFSKAQETGKKNHKSEITKIEIDKPRFNTFLDGPSTETTNMASLAVRIEY
jgi:hypothetical protein